MPNGTEDHVGFFALQSKQTYSHEQRRCAVFERLTLLAGLDFNFSNIFCDCVLVARLILVA